MHVLVVGAGVVGVTTAYYLVNAGHEVTIIDRADDVATGASFANAGQLSYSFTESLANPAFIWQIPRLLCGNVPASTVRISPTLLAWGSRFLAQCTSRRATRNTLALLATAMRSDRLLERIRSTLDLDFSYRPAGKLVLLSSAADVDTARMVAAVKQRHGCETQLLTYAEALQVEPALERLGETFTAAVYSKDDEVGDANLFVKGLRRHLEASGRADFRLGAAASHLTMAQDRVTGVACPAPVAANAVVVCAGAWSRDLLDAVGIRAHIYPVRGYSLTLPLGAAAPQVSITSLRHRIVFSRLNGRMRIAGFADFAGFSTCADAGRSVTLNAIAKRLAPHAADYDATTRSSWGGFRPMTPNGLPYVGATAIPGLFLNTGHGMLGWTLACATAKDTADAVDNAH